VHHEKYVKTWPDPDRHRPLIVFSDYAGILLDKAKMPSDAPAAKIAGARRESAAIVLYDREREDREAIARRLIAGSGATLVPPYDDLDIIAGQGTVACEVAAALADLKVSPSQFIAPCSGGGLAAGCALVVKGLSGLQMVVAEPEGFDDTARSLATDVRVANPKASGSICDALLVRAPGNLTFPILQRAKARGLAVSEELVLAAMQAAAICLKIALEPGGAAGLAAVFSGKLGGDGAPVVVVGSGGNVDAALLQRALAAQSITEISKGNDSDA